MSYNFKLPDIGEGIHEGEIIKWFVKKGDFIEEEQLIAEVMTDKATVELTSPVTGKVVDVPVKEGESIKVGEVFIVFEEMSGVLPEKEPPEPALQQPATEKEDEPPAKKAVDIFSPPEDLGGMYSLKEETAINVEPDAPVRALPRTRKLARQLDVDLHKVTPTGNNGRITDEDVKNFAGGVKPKTSSDVSWEKHTPQTAFISSLPFDVAPITMDGTRKPLTGLRKKIAENMEQSHHFVPRAVHFEELDLTELVKLRKKVKPRFEEKGIKVTYLPFFIKAASVALKEFPQVNACFDEISREIVEMNSINIGFAADTDKGLMVPILKNANMKSIANIAGETAKLSDDARKGKISVDDLKGGSFTLTNIGSIGGLISVPVVYHPQAAIMGMHSITPRPVVRNGEIVIREIMYISLAFDHRIIDGAEAARFTARMKELLENPELLMMEMI